MNGTASVGWREWALVLVLLVPLVLMMAVLPARGEVGDARTAPPKRPLAEGRALFEGKGCARCHTVGERTAAGGGPGLARSVAPSDVMRFAGSVWQHVPTLSAPEQQRQRVELSANDMARLGAYLLITRFFAEDGNAARGCS